LWTFSGKKRLQCKVKNILAYKTGASLFIDIVGFIAFFIFDKWKRYVKMTLVKKIRKINCSKGMSKEKELKKIKEKLEECEKEKEEYLNGWKRTKADFLNYKKEKEERISEIVKYSNESLILKLLPVLDNFEEARQQIDKRENNEMIEGFLQIEKQLKEILKKEGMERIKTEGEDFNPEFHEAVERIEKEKESGKVIEEVRAGFKFKGKIIRPAKVKVVK